MRCEGSAVAEAVAKHIVFGCGTLALQAKYFDQNGGTQTDALQHSVVLAITQIYREKTNRCKIIDV